ncbi:hypothetical protein [Streptomonospora arabica]|uniref:Uncharacterized protein n=1 Tax=Streptomonospora arabica TaxID=412417 RepID=A0ABV9SFD5_9ACTN
MTPGAIDLCELIGDAPPVTLTSRIDEADGPEEVGVSKEGEAWRVSDECSWGFIGQDSQEWTLQFSYTAIIKAGGHDQRFDMAQDEFGENYSSAQDVFGKTASDEESSDKIGRQRELFGTLEDGTQAYILVRQVKSSVYVVDIRGNPSSSGSEDYRVHQFASQASAVSTLVDNPLRDVVPD